MKTTTKTTQVNKRENVTRFIAQAGNLLLSEIKSHEIKKEIAQQDKTIRREKLLSYQPHTKPIWQDNILDAFNKCVFENDCKIMEVFTLRTYIVFIDEATGERFWFVPVLPRGHKEIKAIKEKLMFKQCTFALTYKGYNIFHTHFHEYDKPNYKEIPNASIWAYYQGMNFDTWGKSVAKLFTYDLLGTRTNAKIKYEDVILLSANERKERHHTKKNETKAKAKKAKNSVTKKTSK